MDEEFDNSESIAAEAKPEAINASCRGPVLFLFASAAVWLVQAALAEDRALTAFKLADLHAHSEDFGEDALVLLDVRHSLELRNIEGGTGPQAVAEQLEKARGVLAAG